MRVRWKRSTGDYVESHCNRWWITPIYGGCTRPERYELRLDNQVVGGGANQRECKEVAERISKDRYGDMEVDVFNATVPFGSNVRRSRDRSSKVPR